MRLFNPYDPCCDPCAWEINEELKTSLNSFDLSDDTAIYLEDLCCKVNGADHKAVCTREHPEAPYSHKYTCEFKAPDTGVVVFYAGCSDDLAEDFGIKVKITMGQPWPGWAEVTLWHDGVQLNNTEKFLVLCAADVWRDFSICYTPNMQDSYVPYLRVGVGSVVHMYPADWFLAGGSEIQSRFGLGTGAGSTGIIQFKNMIVEKGYYHDGDEWQACNECEPHDCYYPEGLYWQNFYLASGQWSTWHPYTSSRRFINSTIIKKTGNDAWSQTARFRPILETNGGAAIVGWATPFGISGSDKNQMFAEISLDGNRIKCEIKQVINGAAPTLVNTYYTDTWPIDEPAADGYYWLNVMLKYDEQYGTFSITLNSRHYYQGAGFGPTHRVGFDHQVDNLHTTNMRCLYVGATNGYAFFDTGYVPHMKCICDDTLGHDGHAIYGATEYEVTIAGVQQGQEVCAGQYMDYDLYNDSFTLPWNADADLCGGGWKHQWPTQPPPATLSLYCTFWATYDAAQDETTLKVQTTQYGIYRDRNQPWPMPCRNGCYLLNYAIFQETLPGRFDARTLSGYSLPLLESGRYFTYRDCEVDDAVDWSAATCTVTAKR